MNGDSTARAFALGVILAGAALGFPGSGDASIPNPDRTTDRGAARPGAVTREECDPAIVPAADVEAPVQRVVGQVVRLDEDKGQIVLGTRSGVVPLAAERETIAQLDVGDVIVVEFVPEAEAQAQARPGCR